MRISPRLPSLMPFAALLALAWTGVAPAPAGACTNPLELVMERGAYDAEFKKAVLALSATLDDAAAKMNAGAVKEAETPLDALIDQWSALYTRYAAAPPDGWRGKADWLACLSDVTRAMTLYRTAARQSGADVVHDRERDVYSALSLLFKEDLPYDPDQLNTDNWPLTREVELPGYDPLAVEDAGLFVGQQARDLLAGLGSRTGAVELFFPGTVEAGLADRFVAAFWKHANYKESEPVAISLAVNPAEPLHLLPAAEVLARTGADLLLSCRFEDVAVREREYRSRWTGVRMRRLVRTGLARFRVFAQSTAESGRPLYVDVVTGGFTRDGIYESGTTGVETVREMYRSFDHFPGIDPPAESVGVPDHGHGH